MPLLLLTFGGTLAAAPSGIDAFTDGLGVNLGVSSGLGLSYRSLDTQKGWQATGIIFKTPGTYSTSLAFSGALGRLLPLGAFAITPWLDNVLYLQGAVQTTGTIIADGPSTRLEGYTGVSLSYGLEWLFWEHLSFNFELATAVSAQYFTANNVSLSALVGPQAAVYFRY